VHVDETLSMIEPKQVQGMGGYGVGCISEETEEPFVARIPIPNITTDDGRPLIFKITMAYADLPGASLANDLNLIVTRDGTNPKQRHGNQGDREFPVGAKKPFDRKNNVEQVVWPRLVSSGNAGVMEVSVKPYRMMLADVPFAYAWKFF